MKVIDLCKASRGCALLMALAAVCWFAPGTAMPQEQKKERPISSSAATEMEVFDLKHASARDLGRMIVEICGRKPGHELRVSEDARSNSLVVVATNDDMALVKRLVAAMDVYRAKSEPDARQSRRTVVFQLKYITADPSLDQAIRAVLVGTNGTFSVDPARNAVVVSGDGKTIEAVEWLLGRLDNPQAKARPVEMQVRVVWLESRPMGKEGHNPPEDMKDVVAELAKMGVENPHLVTQTLVSVLPERTFRVEGLTGLETPYRLSVSGALRGAIGGVSNLNISINATSQQTPTAPPQQVARLDTEITAPPGHSVVLGMTPTSRSTSVFVVQILPKK